jgi:3-deoxy-manno-octulosonate cytidylyltransferase (CMP-KDO synthetase)
VPKVVADERGRLLYISRAAIPTNKALEFCTARRQVGLYGFRGRALQAFAGQTAKTPLEQIEDIEILRLLELGHVIQMVEVDSGGPAVDTPDDLLRAHDHLRMLADRERRS